VRCDIVGHGGVEVTPDMVSALRQRPDKPIGEPLSASFLKHLDEQTLVGVAAVFQAIHRHALHHTAFTDWALLGAPRFMGRQALAVALQRYQLEGAWGISPHLIPHRSLHSVSGTISQILKCNGPNFGVSGGLHAADEALLVAASVLAGDRVPGVWLVLTGYNPEPIPERSSDPAPGATRPGGIPVCRAVALALVPGQPVSRHLQLLISPGSVEDDDEPTPSGATPWFQFEDLLAALDEPSPAGSWRLHCGGRAELTKSGTGAENGL
jgi:hypothetical protein